MSISKSIARRRQEAFTLVELLVVIGIIAVLVAILLPALSRARMSAQAVACASNMRQIGLGFIQYASENKGILPAPNVAQGTANQTSWDMAISRQMNARFRITNDPGGAGFTTEPLSQNPFLCPSDDIEAFKVGTQRRSYTRVVFTTNTMFDADYPSNKFYDGIYYPLKLNVGRRSSEVFLLAEFHYTGNVIAGNWHTGMRYYPNYALDSVLVYGINMRQPGTYHRGGGARGGSNYLFFDGHVAAVPFEGASTAWYDRNWRLFR